MLFLINGAFSNRFYNKNSAFSMVLHGIIGAFSNNIDILNSAFSDRFYS